MPLSKGLYSFVIPNFLIHTHSEAALPCGHFSLRMSLSSISKFPLSIDEAWPEKKIYWNNTYEPRSDKRDPLAIKVKSEIFTEKERPSCCEQLQKIWRDYLYK